jgi:hypothetical protein
MARTRPVNVDTEISGVFRADEVELAVPVVVPPYLDRPVPLTERLICSAMEVETVDAAVLTRDEDRRPVDVVAGHVSQHHPIFTVRKTTPTMSSKRFGIVFVDRMPKMFRSYGCRSSKVA